MSTASAQRESRTSGAIGLGTPSIDHRSSKTLLSHRILFEAEIPAFENAANPGALPAKDFWVVTLPRKIANGGSDPLRAIAIGP